ncbi:MAG: 2-oxo-4-hydroxy-4-carboxy-5-ureidoimidazoline decarboxylase [Candidatus Baltobacteraceae bacterium]
MRIALLNDGAPEEALNAIGSIFEHSQWAAELLLQERPFANVAALHAAIRRMLRNLPPERRIELIAAHPELGTHRGALTSESKHEQTAAGVSDLRVRDRERFQVLNASYRERFGFPFVICARENTKETIAAALTARLMNGREAEISIAVDEIAKIASLRANEILTE